jgi:hypothetical protein
LSSSIVFEFWAIKTIGSKGTGLGQFNAIYGIGVSNKGYVYVADGNSVQKFNTTLACCGKFKGMLHSPTSVKLMQNGKLLVADKDAKRVFMFTMY